MNPLPWSPSNLDKFTTCPKQYYETVVLKKFKQEKTTENLWGDKVHKDFELRIKDKKDLPNTLVAHNGYMLELESLPGEIFTEQKIALNTKLEPCDFFDPKVWFRGAIDFKNINNSEATIIDYKSGKPHSKFRQLDIYAWYTFLTDKVIETINAKYYWTKFSQETKKLYSRADLPQLWGALKPDIVEYRNAFKSNTWQPKPSGLCRGYCPVTTCEFWKPKRNG